MKLRYTPRARSDIADIHEWIAERNPRAATAVVDRIQWTTALLSERPGIGRPTNIPGVRVLPVVRYPYLVYHAIEDDTLVIVHVRHGARDAPRAEEL